LKRATILLALVLLQGVFPGVSFGHLGSAAEKVRLFLRWVWVVLTIAVLIWVLWALPVSLSSVVTNGAAYWASSGILAIYVSQLICSKRSLRVTRRDTSQVWTVQVARTAAVTPLVLLSTLTFAYRVFPLVPAYEGGGNFVYSRDARICAVPLGSIRTDPSSVALPESLLDRSLTTECSMPLKILEETDSTIYVARSDDRGNAPAGDRRSAPEIWTDGRFPPMIYAIAKAKVPYIEYSLQRSSH